MKLMLAVVTALSAAAVMAQDQSSVRTGPYVQKVVGEKSSGNYVYCLVTPTSVETTQVVNGEKQPTAVEGAKFDKTEFEGLVADAKKARLERTGVHITQTIPPVRITAGDAPGTADFTVYLDSSDIQQRRGAAAKTLIDRANKSCGKLKPAGSQREE